MVYTAQFSFKHIYSEFLFYLLNRSLWVGKATATAAHKTETIFAYEGLCKAIRLGT